MPTSMMPSLFRNNSTQVESAYIITVLGNENSEKYSARCQESCKEVDMPYKVWPAYNGINPGEIIAPPQMEGDRLMHMLKITDHYLTRGEVACALSHISLWAHCAAMDRPIIVLEHDAIMCKKFEFMDTYNTIVYLGGNEWKNQGWKIYPIPPHASEGPNYLFICRAHAYAIDPQMAKNLLTYVLKYGISAPLDIMMRADVFTVTHQGMYAYDNSIDKLDTTILKRPLEGRTTKRNDKLEW